MSQLLGDVLLAQHRRVFDLLDRCQRRGVASEDLARFAQALLAHVTLEEQILALPLRRIGTVDLHEEEHGVARLLVDRLSLEAPSRVRNARLRVIRDFLVHHIEPEERVVLPAIERIVGARRSALLGRQASIAFDRLCTR